jgi:hypothetical protein
MQMTWFWAVVQPLTGFKVSDPDTERCLTFDRETLSVAVVTTLENIEQAIDLVSYLLKCAGVK